MVKKLLIGLPILALILAGTAWFFLADDESASQRTSVDTSATSAQETAPDSQDTAPKEFLRIAAMGDMLPHDTVNLRAEQADGSYNYTQFFDRVQDRIDGSDIVFCNQESPSAGAEFGITGYPAFNAPAKFSEDLNGVGCNVINLANNHIADKGQTVIDRTLATWEGLDTLAVSGANSSQAQQDTVSYFEVEGIKFAFIAFTDLSNNTSLSSYSVNMFGEALVTKLSAEAAANADYVIASAHWGTEDSEIPNQSQRDWAQLMSDNGVDLIIGTGPHVLQPVEKIGDTIVFYSLGNFLSTQLTIEQLTGGIAYIDIPLAGGEPKLSFLPTYMSYTWTSSQEAAQDYLSRDNLELYPLDEAAAVINDSLFDTTADQQRSRIIDVLGDAVEIEILR